MPYTLTWGKWVSYHLFKSLIFTALLVILTVVVKKIPMLG